jgi:hypothetical protein
VEIFEEAFFCEWNVREKLNLKIRKKVQKFGNRQKEGSLKSIGTQTIAEEIFSQILHKFADSTSLKIQWKTNKKQNHELSLSSVSFGEFLRLRASRCDLIWCASIVGSSQIK